MVWGGYLHINKGIKDILFEHYEKFFKQRPRLKRLVGPVHSIKEFSCNVCVKSYDGYSLLQIPLN